MSAGGKDEACTERSKTSGNRRTLIQPRVVMKIRGRRGGHLCFIHKQDAPLQPTYIYVQSRRHNLKWLVSLSRTPEESGNRWNWRTDPNSLFSMSECFHSCTEAHKTSPARNCRRQDHGHHKEDFYRPSTDQRKPIHPHIRDQHILSW